MKKLVLSLMAVILFLPPKTAKADLGFNLGMGIPFVSQFGVDLTMGDNFTLSVGHNNLNLSSDAAEVDLSMQNIILNWHPFGGVFYIGGGVGKETLTAKAEDKALNASAEAEVTANVALARVGWMWGKMNSGFWFGMDITYISPSGGDVKIKTTGFTATDQEYQDVKDAGEAFGETAYTNFTFARFGWLF